ncbi:MAG: MBL fold metallo-hydrolase [Myxococcales bacterium]|nr:MBL fold metallo-hydrolase [Myxococcales bacterium]
MAKTIREMSERAWRGEVNHEEIHPRVGGLGLEEVAEDLAFIHSFGNSVALRTAEGLVVVDTGSPFHMVTLLDALRGWSDAPIHTVILTHGHVDHVMGLGLFEQDAKRRGHAGFRVVAHENLPARLDRYKLTAGYNGVINARQFGLDTPLFPTEFRYPDRVYRDELVLEIGGARVELRHARGETDDATWVWLPAQRALASGDFVIWATPNCGNPQKAQRYPREWAQTLRAMHALAPELILPGHGMPIWGAERCAHVLADGAALLESIVEQTLALMNQGATLDRVLAEVVAPADLLGKAYLGPIYDEPEFIVRNLWRLYGGWYDGNPARLKPARDDEVARELAEAAGGAEALMARAEARAEEGALPLACHLAELAGRADASLRNRRAAIYRQRATVETSLMARSIFTQAAERD